MCSRFIELPEVKANGKSSCCQRRQERMQSARRASQSACRTSSPQATKALTAKSSAGRRRRHGQRLGSWTSWRRRLCPTFCKSRFGASNYEMAAQRAGANVGVQSEGVEGSTELALLVPRLRGLRLVAVCAERRLPRRSVGRRRRSSSRREGWRGRCRGDGGER